MEKGDTLTQNREEDKPVELRVLRYFLAVVRMQSISAAAEELHITQPTLSRQLMELEEELGAKLFRSSGNALHADHRQKIAQNP